MLCVHQFCFREAYLPRGGISEICCSGEKIERTSTSSSSDTDSEFEKKGRGYALWNPAAACRDTTLKHHVPFTCVAPSCSN